MISVVICSINPERCEILLKNISETIGVEYEAIVFDNRKANWGICRVYNHCAEKAKYPFLCFAHEDLLFGTKGWGNIIINFIERTPNCGVVGFAGGFQAHRNFSSYWTGKTVGNVCDGYNGNNNTYLKINYIQCIYSNPYCESASQVLCIDGLFHFVRRSIWEEIRYDEMRFSGFHFYDTDFTLSVSEKYNNYVLLNIDIFHDSGGFINAEYVKNMFIFQEKWNKKLPKYITHYSLSNNRLSNSEILKYELRGAFESLRYCYMNRISLFKFFRQIYKINKISFFVLTLIYIPIKLILKKMSNVYDKI